MPKEFKMEVSDKDYEKISSLAEKTGLSNSDFVEKALRVGVSEILKNPDKFDERPDNIEDFTPSPNLPPAN